ncbi:MAG: translation initiation factor IF-2 N-terminal domain-containing protein, partial [Alsobacter sp.]
MSDTKNSGDKTLSVPSKTLSLKRPVEQGMVRQSFSHGRSKSVVVEKVKRRVIGPGDGKPETVAAPAPAPVPAKPPMRAPSPSNSGRAAPPPPAARPQQQSASARPAGVVLRTLTEEERDARAIALVEARRREEDERRQAVIDSEAREEREAREKIERDAAEARKRDEDMRHRREEEVRRKAEDEAKRRLGDTPRPAGEAAAATPAAATPAGTPAARRPLGMPTAPGRAVEAEEDDVKRVIRRPGMPLKIITPPKPDRARAGDEKRRGRLTVTTATGDDEERTRSVAAFRRRVQRLKGHAANEPKEKIAREVVIPETITIQELANRMAERGVDVIRFLMKEGQLHKITDVIDADSAQLIAEEFGHT